MRHYCKYIGCYVKRFYNPFQEESIWKISGYREVTYVDENGVESKPVPEFHYVKRQQEEFWSDVDDSVIITNNQVLDEDERVISVHDPKYKGFNPYTGTRIDNSK